MNFRHTIIAMIAAIASPAFAAPDFVVVAGEIGYVPQTQPGTASRTTVLAELNAWKRNPVTSDGWRQTSGQVGWEYVGRPSTLTRQQVQLEASRSARQVETADGYRFVGGEAGWVYVGTRRGSESTTLHGRAGPR